MPYQPSYEQYIVALSRKAKNHSAREYRFRAAGEAGDTKATPAPRRSAAALKAITTKYVRALQEGKWFDEIRECRAKCDVYEFIHIQERLLTELSLHPYYIPACLQAVHKRSKSKMVSLYDMLASTASTFGKLHCPDAAVPALFALLERPLPATLPEGEVKYQKQIERACSPPDRQLGRQEHPRCVGFLPTQLQRDVMECVDHGENVVMRSPTGTGKTMISLYLAQCTRDRGKATLYVAPTKLICNEFSIFAYHQGLRISINTEDFSSRREIREALLRQGILIWTPEELFMYLLNPSEGLDLLSQVGSIIFDELPRMLTTHRSATSFLLLAAATRELQMMVLSANISNDTVDHLLNELALFSLQESGDALKPTDLLLHTYEPQDKRLQLIETSSLYTRELLRRREGDRLSIALRIPITWKEFYAHSQRYATEEFHATCHEALPAPKTLRGVDLTRLTAALHAKKEMPPPPSQRNNEPSTGGDLSGSDEEEESEGDSDHVSDEEAKQLFDFLMVLRQQQMLPVMIFHTNRLVLNEYHAKCTALLLAVEERRAASTLTPIQRKPTAKKNPTVEEMQDAAEDRPTPLPPLFGHVGHMELREFFKHRGHRLGMAAQQSQQSRFWEGISLGLGIFHHGVERKSRDAVENSLRSKAIHVVFTDASMAFGLNLPVKTVVLLPDDSSMLTADQFLQAAGRAGRWGYEECGHVVFYKGLTPSIGNIWNAFEGPSPGAPFSPTKLLPIITSSASIARQVLHRLLTLSVRAWDLTPATTQEYLRAALLRYQSLHFLTVDKKRWAEQQPFDYRLIADKVKITRACRVAATLLYTQGGHFAAYCVSRHGKQLEQLVQTPREFFFFISHCMDWRSHVDGYGRLEPDMVSPALWELMATAQEGFCRAYETSLLPTRKLTALYVNHPSRPSSEDPLPADVLSLRFHVHEKARKVHSACGFTFPLEN